MPVRSQAKRILVVILCALLFIPLLAAVPVYAAAASGNMPNALVTWSLTGDTLLISGQGTTGSFASIDDIPWSSSSSSIKHVVFSPGISSIGSKVLSGLSLDSISLPSSLTSLSNSAFSRLTIDSLVIPSSVSSLPYRCFYLSHINSLYIPSSVTSIANSFAGFSGDVYMESVDPPIWDIDPSTSVNVKFYVPYGSALTYKNDSDWDLYASQIYEIDFPLEDPSIPTLTTSFDGQVISLDAGSLRFFITATNVNGILSCQWYVNGAPISGEWSFIEAEPGVWLQGWVYTPIENGTREIYCIVTNTIGDKSASVSTGTVIVHYGVSGGGGGGSGDLSEVTDKLEVLDMDISELKNSVQAVQDSVDALPDKITDGIQGIVDQENENAESEGNKFVDQITGLVPNDSQGFIDSMGSLVNVLSYDGTDCVLTIPALTIPAIEPHFSEFTVLEAQQLDFEEYINMMPPNLLLLIRSLLTGALIVYCFKELYGVISYFLVLKGGET